MKVSLITTALVLALLGAGASEGDSSSRATLKLVRGAPLTLRGAHFVPGERVRVSVTSERKTTRRVTANGSGTFVVGFSTVEFDRCNGLLAVATGSRGSQATLKRPQPQCPPRL